MVFDTCQDILWHSDNPKFDDLILDRTYNRAIGLETVRPRLLALPNSIADVVRVVRYANEHQHTVSVRTGGHNWFGVSLQSDLVIDMRYFDDLAFHDEDTLATVGPAVVGQVLNEKANERQLWFPSGHCVGVPLGGYLLGGGFGWFQYAAGGMASELVRSLRIVTANGDILEVNDEQHPEWMWLARGSASAFPAVVVSMTLQLQPLPTIIRHQTNAFVLERYKNLVQQLCQLQLQQKLSSRLELAVVPACTPPFLNEKLHPVPDKVCLCSVYAMADSEEEFREMVAPLETVLSPENPSLLHQSEFEERTLSELTSAIGHVYPPGLAWDVRSYQVETELYANVDWDALRNAFHSNTPNQSLSHILTVIGPDTQLTMGGAYGTTLPGLVVAGYGAMDVAATRGVREQCEALLDSMEATLGESAAKCNPLEHPVHGGTFSKCFPLFERLQELRRKYDPHGRFLDPSLLEKHQTTVKP